MVEQPTYKITRLGSTATSVYKDDRYVGDIKKRSTRFEASTPHGVVLGWRKTLGGALDLLIAEEDRIEKAIKQEVR